MADKNIIKIISLIIKPTDACNLRCKHCYAAETGYVHERMTLNTVKEIFDLFAKDYDELRIIWHGGEPLLMGMDFFENVMMLQREYKDKQFVNSIQTNATLITEDWVDFFIKNNIKLGISYDGQFNDVLRMGSSQVLRAINIMKSKDYKFGAICVVCDKTVDKLIDIYEFFKCLGVPYKINPIFDAGEAKNNSSLGLSPSKYAKEFIAFFKYWLNDTNCNINVDHPLSYVSSYFGRRENLCAHTSCLTKWLGIHFNGDIYPCGRSYPKEYRIGNINEFDSCSSIFLSKNFQYILNGAIKRREQCMNNCNLFERCRGGCNNSAILAGDITKTGFQDCEIYQLIIPAIEDILEIKFSQDIDEVLLLNPTINRDYFAKR